MAGRSRLRVGAMLRFRWSGFKDHFRPMLGDHFAQRGSSRAMRRTASSMRRASISP